MSTIIDLTLILPRNPNKPYQARDPAVCEFLVWHHTAGPTSQTPEQIARFHLSKGWSGIGYTYMVYPDAVYKVRPIGVIPACVQGSNTKSICICFAGNYEISATPDSMVESGIWLTELLLHAYPNQPWKVRGHREMPGQQTDCPGKYLLTELDRIRTEKGWLH